MGKAVSSQHPAVVLRSHYNHVRALLAVAMIAVVGLTVTVVILAGDDGRAGTTNAARPADASPLPASTAAPRPGIRFDGGPEEGRPGTVAAPAPITRFDGGPEEGTRGP